VFWVPVSITGVTVIDSALAAATLINLLCIFALRWKSRRVPRILDRRCNDTSDITQKICHLLVIAGGNCSEKPLLVMAFVSAVDPQKATYQ